MKEYRREYVRGKLELGDLLENPHELFEEWFRLAGETDGIHEPNQMILSTATIDGQPRSRVVLLKEISETGYVFYTNYDSQKGQDIEANPRVSILFYWEALERQVRIEGRARRISQERSQAYYDSRPRGSRIGAWTSPQSEAISGREELDQRYREVEDRFRENATIQKPPFWGGYEVIPERFEFWQGRKNRLHDRFVFVQDGEKWKITRIAP